LCHFVSAVGGKQEVYIIKSEVEDHYILYVGKLAGHWIRLAKLVGKSCCLEVSRCHTVIGWSKDSMGTNLVVTYPSTIPVGYTAVGWDKNGNRSCPAKSNSEQTLVSVPFLPEGKTQGLLCSPWGQVGTQSSGMAWCPEHQGDFLQDSIGPATPLLTGRSTGVLKSGCPLCLPGQLSRAPDMTHMPLIPPTLSSFPS
jgi:hypothetical protein